MNPTLEHKGYLGSVEISIEDGVIHGKLLFIRDIVSYEADSPAGIEAAFRAAVDSYLETCAECGDQPDTPPEGVSTCKRGRGRAPVADCAAATPFPISPETRRPIGGIPARTLGEFRALTASLPDETLLTNDEDAVIELTHDADSKTVLVNASPDL